MDNDALTGDTIPPNAPSTPSSDRSLALVRRISRGAPPAQMQNLVHGPIGEAVAEAARYADAAISETTRAAYQQA